jgi:hypothetical protein
VASASTRSSRSRSQVTTAPPSPHPIAFVACRLNDSTISGIGLLLLFDQRAGGVDQHRQAGLVRELLPRLDRHRGAKSRHRHHGA